MKDIFMLLESSTPEEKLETYVGIAAMHMIKAYAQITKFTSSWATSIYRNISDVRSIIAKGNKTLKDKLIKDDIIANNIEYIKRKAMKETGLSSREIDNAYYLFRNNFNVYDFVYRPDIIKSTIDTLIVESNMAQRYKDEALKSNETIYLTYTV